MIGKIINRVNSSDCIVLVNGVMLKTYMLEDLEINKPKKITFIPFITSKVEKENLLNLNLRKNKRLVIDDFEKSSYQAYGEIVSLKPLSIDCGAIQIELDEEDLHSEIQKSDLQLGMYIYFYIDRLDIENA